MSEPFSNSDKSFLTIKKWKTINPNLQVGFTTRNGGISKSSYHSLNLGLNTEDNQKDVISNRTILANKLELSLDKWVFGEQVHQTNIHIIHSRNNSKIADDFSSSIPGVDGIITKEKGLLLTAFFADCVPLYFYDPVSNYIGIAHAGWRGSVHQIARKMVEKFQSLKVDLKDLQVVIGPSISQENYEVDSHVINHMDEKYWNTVKPVDKNHFLLDLKQLNVEILLQAGLFRNNIEITNYCTFAEKTLFFSHRRDEGKTGRMLGFIGFSE